MSKYENTLSNLHFCVEKHDAHKLRKHVSKGKTLQEKTHLQAAFFESKKWDKGSTVTISFMPQLSEKVKWTDLEQLKIKTNPNGEKVKLDPLETRHIRKLSHEDAVKKIVKQRIIPICNLNFEFVDSGGMIRISFMEGKGSWSNVGTDCLETKKSAPTMNFGWLDVATVMHEFGHAIGLIHEHQNPRGKGISWDKQKVYAWAASTQGWDKNTAYNNIIMKYELDQINGSEYDPYSIMLYFFPAELTTDNKGSQQNLILSKVDVKWISKEYPGSKMSVSSFLKQTYDESETRSNNTTIIIIIIFIIIVIIIVVLLLLKYNNISFHKLTNLISF